MEKLFVNDFENISEKDRFLPTSKILKKFEKYPISNKFVNLENSIGVDCKFPVIVKYKNENILCENYDNFTFNFNKSGKNNYELLNYFDESLLKKLDKLFAYENYWNGYSVKLVSYDVNGKNINFTYKDSNYYYGFITIWYSDLEWKNNTIREKLIDSNEILTKDKSNFIKLNESKMSNHLGYNMNMITKDGFLILPIRNDNTIVNINCYGVSIGGGNKERRNKRSKWW